jgi:ubiquinone/menaquinone biosynthesis C-methylase UbiE
MGTYMLMKILESAPNRYDQGIRLLTLGSVDKAYDRLAAHVEAGQRVLDLGCGTGALTLRAAQRGATVKGIDVNAQMLEIARKKVDEADLAQRVELCEMGVAELGGDPAEHYDVVMSGLCFSELTEGERAYALQEAHRMLKPGGTLLLADEVIPRRVFRRILHWLIRLPLAVITYLLAGTTTHAIRNLPQRVQKAGFEVVSTHLNPWGSFIELIAVKPGGEKEHERS